MAEMSAAELKTLLTSSRNSALSAMQASKLSSERSDAMAYYMGDVSADLPVPDGRSRAVSTDVSDTIESLMPQLVEIFVGGDEVVKFSPVGPEDEQAAEQETDYINHVFMQKNPGFLILYSFIKDALLSKNGIVKVWWEEEEREKRETFYDLTDEQYMALQNEPSVEIVEHSEKDYPDGEGEDARA